MAKQSSRVSLTAGRIEALQCPADKSQALVWDTQSPALLVRIAKGGRKTYAFESRLNGKTIRITIGDVRVWQLAQARAEANRLKTLTDSGQDPRELKRLQRAEQESVKALEEARTASVSEVWRAYIKDRSSRWGDLHKKDHIRLARAPGKTKAGKPTKAGPLYYFMGKRLAELTPPVIEAWAKKEGETRPTSARLSWRLLRAFLTWCTEHDDYSAVIPENPAKTNKTRESLGTPKPRVDVLERSQLPAFVAAAKGLKNPVPAVYIQCLLLLGGRPSEVLALKWDDINARWGSLTIRDKDNSKGGEDGTRTIPLTPYVHHLLAGLPRRSEWVFSSDTLNQPIALPYDAMGDVCSVAGISRLGFNGLRRSFGSLSEWLEIPAGVIAQIQGHKPSATAEKHYRVRPLDLLRLHHERFEAWILEQAGIEFDPSQQPGALRVVAGGEA